MKSPKLLALTGLGAAASLSPAEPLTQPIGHLDIDASLVRLGAHPSLGWEITYPTPLEDIVSIDDPGEITVTTRTQLEIRVVGVAFQSGETLLPAALQAQFDGGAWETLFSGTGPEVDPSSLVYSGTVEAGTTLNLSATGGNPGGGWSFSANTITSSAQVTHLRDGDHVPHYIPAYDQGTIESYLTQFISSESVVTAGPRDLVYLFELGTTNTGSGFFDMQDIAVVLTFKDIKESTSP